MEERPTLLMKVAPVILSLFAGAVLGFVYRGAIKDEIRPPASQGGSMGGMMGGGGAGGAGGAGGMMGGGGGGRGGGGGQPSSATTLPRTIRNLATIEKVQGKGVSILQANQISRILGQLKSADKLSEKECDEKLKAIETTLNEEQKQALKDLQPARGGGGGGMGGGARGAGAMGGAGGGAPDPEKPFASERNKQALEDLITALKTKAK